MRRWSGARVALTLLTLSVVSGLGLGAQRADAACATSGAAEAYGDFWVERTGASCDCKIYQRKYACVASGGVRTESAAQLIGTVSGDCTRSCEDSPGYDAVIATARTNLTGSYGCDTTFIDADNDGFGSCIDNDDGNPRVWVKTSGNERTCDGIDNDGDGTIDDGFGSACPLDAKRTLASTNLQGDSEDHANLVEGQYLRREVDAVVAGPYGALILARTYSSRRATNDANLGVGWMHSFATYLQVMPSGDDRIMVETGTGEREFFRCDAGTTDRSCVIDDHRPRGNLRRIASAWYYYPGDGTVFKFRESTYSGRQPWQYRQDASGYTIAESLVDANGRVTRVSSAKSNIFLSFAYGAAGLDAVRISSDTVNQVLDYDVVDSGFVKLDRVKFAGTVNTIDADTAVIYTYDANQNLTTVQKKLDTATTITVASASYDAGTDRVSTLKAPRIDLALTWTSAMVTTVTFGIEATGNPSTAFTRDGLWIRSRNSVDHVGGMRARTEVRDDHGRVTCREADDSRMTKFTYGDSTEITRIDTFGKAGDCTSGGSVDRREWFGYSWNSHRQIARPAWNRRSSVYNGAADCSGVSRPSGCSEVAYTYVSSTDGRLQWITQTGTTRLISGSTVEQVRKQRTFFYGLDTSICVSTDSYTGLPCREEDQDGAGSVFTRIDFTYVPSGSTAGLPKSVAVHDKSGDAAPHTTTYASHNLFGTPTSVTSPTGVVTSYVMNGWDAATSITETGALLDDAWPTPGTLSPQTSLSYNKARQVDTVTLPKGNKLRSVYESTGETFGRLRAQATADAAGNFLEITRFVYDRMGNPIEERVLDSISGTTPCADEACGTYDIRRERKYNALRQVTEAYLHAANQNSPPDATKSYTYTNGQLTQVSDFVGTNASFAYDDQGRRQSSALDTTGINAATTYNYDLWGRTATVTSPTSVSTTYETDDFGQKVLERSRTTGEARFEYDAKGALAKKRRSVYKSTTSAEDTCYTSDWMGRQLTVDWDCDAASNWTLSYDGDGQPASACPSTTRQTGHLSKLASNGFTRVLCYHPSGELYAAYQRDSATWSNTVARGTNLVYDTNGNLRTYFTNVAPGSRSYARQVEYVYDGTLKDRVSYVRHKLTSAGSWTELTSSTTLPTYFAQGGIKTLRYANGITETNERDIAGRTTRKRTDDGSTVYTDINLTYDVNGNITLYDDSTGLRHQKYYAAVDKLDRLRCLSRSSISSCTGTKPWESKFTESFDYDKSGNRTNRRGGGFTADDEVYAYVSGPTDIIDKVTVNGSAKEQSNTFKGQITATNIPGPFAYSYDREDHLANSNDNSLGNVGHYHTLFADRYARQSTCNARRTYFYSMPAPESGASPQTSWINLYNTCLAEFPRQLHTYVWLGERPLAVVRSEIASGTDAQTELGTFWVHVDHLGTPVLVTQSDKTERWRWENDPFGRGDPVEYTVSGQDVNPDDDASSGTPLKYNTCCCGGGGCGAGCNQCQTSCSAGQCTGGGSQDVLWQKTYTVSGANNVRLHFSTFDVAAGTTRTGKDYVRLLKGSDGTTVVADLTGNLGDFWGPWAGVGESSIVMKLYGDNVQDDTRGFVVASLCRIMRRLTDDRKLDLFDPLRPGAI
jgi:YD repeat-containing protein